MRPRKNKPSDIALADDDDINPGGDFAAVACRGNRIDIFRALQTFRRQFECPRDDERDGKSNRYWNDN